MKKNRCLISVFLLLFLTLSLFGCNIALKTPTNDVTGEDNLKKLSTPTVYVSDTGLASWEAVANSSGYMYKINNDKEYKVTNLRVQLVEGQSIKVKALGDGKNYADSDYSNEVIYTVESVVTPIKLSSPIVSVDESGLASWNAILGASGYIYQIDDENEFDTTDLAVQLVEGQSIKVKALGDGINYTDSEYSTSVFYYINDEIIITDAMPEIENSLSRYKLGNTQTINNDGHIGIPFELTVFFDSSNTVEYGCNGTPIILYTINTYTRRFGTDSDVSIIQSMLDRGYVVVVLDYKNNTKATCPALDWSAQRIRSRLMTGEFFKNINNLNSNTTYYQTFIVPAGYDVSLNHVYWEFDKHGSDGTFDKIIEVWNNDFRKGKGEEIIKWVDESGNRKATQNCFNNTSPIWLNSDGTTNANGKYIKIKYTKAEKITDCVKSDGSPIDLNLYMHLIYPTNPKKPVPVMALNSSSEHLAKGSATLDRPQIAGFAFQGYASVMFDFGYTPMARDDHYGFFGHQVTGDTLSYGVHFYSDKKIGTAAMRYIRYLSLSKEKFNFDINAVGVYGNSKGGWVTFLGEEHPELLIDKRIAPNHHGETRYDNGDTITYGVIDGGEPQPWLTYNGERIDSGADFVYASCGGLEENITEGHAPTFISCNKGDGSYYSSSNGFVNMCRIYNVPALWFEVDKGHTLTSGVDINYGLDTYPALFDFANFYLRKDAVKLLYTNLWDDNNEIETNKELFFMFSGGVDAQVISKLTPISSGGVVADGIWTSLYGGTWWTFTPNTFIENETYTVNIPKNFSGTNGVKIREELNLFFTTKVENLLEVNVNTTENGTYIWFDINECQNYIIRTFISENASNTLQLYSVQNFSSSNPSGSTIGQLIDEKIIYKSGNVEFDVSSYCANFSNGETVAFILKQKNNASEVTGVNINFDKDKGGVSIAGKIVYEVGVAPDNSSALKIVEMQTNSNYTNDDFYNNITTVAARYNIIKAGTSGKLTMADVGRKFKISLKIYDTYSRNMQVYLSSPTSATNEISDYNWSVQNFYTVANQWITIEFDYIVYEAALYPEISHDVPRLMIKASSCGNIESPFYIDSITSTEIFENINIGSINVIGVNPTISVNSTTNVIDGQNIDLTNSNGIYDTIYWEHYQVNNTNKKSNSEDIVSNSAESLTNAFYDYKASMSWTDGSNNINANNNTCGLCYENMEYVINVDVDQNAKKIIIYTGAYNATGIAIMYDENGSVIARSQSWSSTNTGIAVAVEFELLVSCATTVTIKITPSNVGSWGNVTMVAVKVEGNR